MSIVRFGVVGLGMIGSLHARSIHADRGGQMKLAAVCSEVPQQALAMAAELDVPAFTDVQKLIDSGLCDALVIATPHYWHAPMAIRCARAGLHILCEKPLSVTVGPAREMVRLCRQNKVHFGAMLQHRTRPVMKRVKQMVDGGDLGKIHRVSLITTSWYRTQAYYDSAAWRGTWEDEGGGVLLNQSPHHLDLLQWIIGMPSRVMGLTGTRLHRIEVENSAQALCQYDDGKTAYIYTSTADAPAVEQLIISGDKGTLLADREKLLLGRLKTPISCHLFSCPKHMEEIPCQWREIKVKNPTAWDHRGVTKAFVRHVLGEGEMVADGASALNELELSNAIYLSSNEGRAVDLPVDAGEMDRLIGRLAKKGQGKAGTKGSLGFRSRAARELKKLLAEC